MIYLKKLKDKGFKLQSNWQDLKSNSIFVLGTNKQTNFFFYQKKALAKGCKYIICDKKFKNLFLKDKIYYFSYQKKNELNKIYEIFFPPVKLKIIFVTGTNGKTSVAFGIKKLMNLNKIKSSYIGTLGFYVNSKKIKILNNTTPDYLEILNLISYSYKCNCKYVFIEASSIGYCEGRLGNLKYDFCLLTNLKSDHLDYHKTISKYHKSKIDILKNHSHIKSKILLQDLIKIKNLNINKNLVLSQNEFIKRNNILIKSNSKNSYSIITKKNNYNLNTINDFVIKNTISILFLFRTILGHFPNKFNKSIYPKGRSEIIYQKNDVLIMIDYAHSFDAFYNLLSGIKYKGFITVLYGCGGERDKSKRKSIAKLVSRFSHLQIITDDNPRNENPKLIRDTLSNNSKNSISIPNREKAIRYGVNFIHKKKGLLIIAGKGHEETQLIKNKIIKFSDHLIVKKYARNF